MLREGSDREVAQGYVQSSFNYWKRWRLQNTSGKPVLVFVRIGVVLSYSQTEFPVFSFVLIDCHPITQHQREDLGSIFHTPSTGHLY